MPAPRLGALLLALASVAARAASPDAPEQGPDSLALAADDECAAGADAGCALSALQLRGTAVGAKPADNEALTVPEPELGLLDLNYELGVNASGPGVAEALDEVRGADPRSEDLAAHSCAAAFDPANPQWEQDCRLSRSCCDPSLTCFEKGPQWAACMPSCTPGVNYLEPANLRSSWTCKNLGGAASLASTNSALVYNPVGALALPSAARTYTFYVYRAVSDSIYAPYNVNAANLPGVMWYLQNEVVITRPRKFGITRIVRMKMQTKATQPLLDRGMNFGVRYAFDSGMCTGPYDCNEQWQKYGYFVGCNNLGEFPFPTYKVPYQNAIWYSFPGPCPSRKLAEQTSECKLAEPGGACPGSPNGSGSCTYSFTMAGEIRLDDLEMANGGAARFWAKPNDESMAQYRVKLAALAFAKKYPTGLQDWHLPSPPCDFNYDRFYNQ